MDYMEGDGNVDGDKETVVPEKHNEEGEEGVF